MPLLVSVLSASVSGRVVLDGVDLQVRVGEKVALMGRNGAGKTTLVRSILGLQKSNWERLSIAGVTPTTRTRWRHARQQCAWAPQAPEGGDFPLTVRELLTTSANESYAHARAAMLGVDALWRRPIGELSGGQRQRVFLARAMAEIDSGATLFIADEPTAALDEHGKKLFAAAFADIECSAVVVTHDEDLARSCSRRLWIESGKLRSRE